jgi:hypothetical protein
MEMGFKMKLREKHLLIVLVIIQFENHVYLWQYHSYRDCSDEQTLTYK